VRAVARAHGATPAQVRLAWTLGQGPHVLAIPGTGDPDHLAENVAAGALRLTDEEMARLDSPEAGAGTAAARSGAERPPAPAETSHPGEKGDR
jgi:aryl-alcohol dehydrogenase-like predicted oxidoreductase